MDPKNYKMLKNFVSIIIPTYNGKEYICETIKSAISQTYPLKEIIIVDDGSEYDLSELLSPYMDKINLIRQKNQGPGAARKLGVLKSTGEFIAFLDHDDLWAPDKIEAQVSLIKSNKECGLVYSYPILIDSKGDIIPNESPSYFPEGNIFDQFIKKNRITTFSATLLRKEAYYAVGGIDEDLKYETCDDYDLWLRIASKYVVKYSSNSKVYYRIHHSNLLKSYEKNLFAHPYVLEKISREIISNKSGKEKKTLNRALKLNLFEHYKKYAFLYYYDHQKENNSEIAKKLFRKAFLTKFDIKVFIYYLLSFKTTSKGRKKLRKIRGKYNFFKLLFEPKELFGKIKKKIWLYREKKRNSEEYYQYMLRYSGVKIGKDCQIMRSVVFADPVLVKIGNNVLVSGGVKFLTHDGAPMLFKDEIGPKFIYEPITVGNNVFIGMNAIINKGVDIGDNVIIGAGSVVNKSIPSNTIVMGNPAKTVFKMSMAEKMMKNHKNLLINKHTLNSIKDIDEKIISHFKLTKNNFDKQFYLFDEL